MTRRDTTRRQFLQLAGGAALVGAATGTASASESVSTAPVPDDPGAFTYATMGEGSNPTATLYGNFKCPYTREFVLGNLDDVIDEFVAPGKLDLRYRALAYEPDPDDPSHGSSYYYISDSDPRISECAMGAWDADPHGYWRFFRDMFETQVSGTVTYDEMRDRMADSGVDGRDAAISRAEDGRYHDPVYWTRDAAYDVEVPFTPTLELNGDTTAPHHDTQEVLDWIADHLPASSSSTSTSGEAGRATVRQGSTGDWFGQPLSGTYDAPVVVAKSTSYDGADPTHVRLRAVDDDRFEFRLEEWEYEDGPHTSETVGYLAFDAGTHSLDGATVEAGTVWTDHGFSDVSFDADFGGTPVVFSQPQTRRGLDAIVTRNRDVSADGMAVRCQEQDAYGAHMDEQVGYLAVGQGYGTLGDAAFEAGRTADAVTHEWHEVTFDREYLKPQFVADLQTYHGYDASQVRYRNLTSSGVEVKVEEERSVDDETIHRTERVGYLVVEGT
ncbi:DsbA family protein [Halomicrococcus gelatinilyticus]|uniref:DsbA family protein n=1 Tax=Halomicrococcus gelatinilyticus TaxID=1702103 RepID=UPI002E10D005